MSNYSDSSFKDDANSSWYKTFHLVPKGTTVLDIGCSSGSFGEQLIAQKGCTVDGIEIDDGDISEAKKVLRKVYKLDIERDNLDIQTRYDVIFMGDVVEHLAQPAKALAKIKKLLKPNGILVFSIPNITHMLVRIMLMGGTIDYGRTGLLDETHLHFYNSKEIHHVFNEAGYHIKKFDFTVNDMPFELVEQELGKLGLETTKKFKETIQSTDGAAYQFIGVAEAAKTPTKQTLPKSSPHNTVETYINEVKAQYEKAVNDLLTEREKIITDLNGLAAERDKLKAQLAAADKLPAFIKRKTKSVARKLKK